MSRRLRFVAAAVLMSVASPCQTVDPQPRASFSTNARYVLVPVVVSDQQGKHVSGLGKADFRVLENGKPRNVASVEEIHATAQPVTRASTKPNEFSNEIAGDAAPRRLVIILVDLLNSDFVPQVYARRAVLDYLAAHLESDSLYQIAVLDSQKLTYLHDFTDDTQALINAAKQVVARSEEHGTEVVEGLSRASTTVFSPSGDEAEMRSALDQTVHLKTLLDIANRVSGLPGRKELIWLTTSTKISVDPGNLLMSRSANQPWVSSKLYFHTMTALDRAQIAIYPVDPSGLEANEWNASGRLPLWKPLPPLFGGKTSANRHRVETSPAVADAANARRERMEGMRSIANATGGRAYFNRNDTENLIHDAVKDGSSYYMLSYPVDKSDARPGWRRISVSAGNYHVRARTGYFFDDVSLDPAATVSADVDLALTSPLDYTGLPLRLTIGDPTPAGERYRVPITLLVGKGAVQADAGANNRICVAYSYLIRSDSGVDAGHRGMVVDRHLTAVELQRTQTDGMGYADTVELPPGSYTIRMVARDNLTGRIGSVLGAVVVK